MVYRIDKYLPCPDSTIAIEVASGVELLDLLKFTYIVIN